MTPTKPTQHSERVSRRAFHKKLAGLGAGAIASSSLLGSESRAEPTSAGAATQPAKGKYIDIHCHLAQAWNQMGAMTPEMLLRWMDAKQIERAVVLPLISPESWHYPVTTHWVLEQTKPFRERLIPFCDVDPRSVNLRGYRGFVDILKRYVDAGAKGLGEHKWGGKIDDPRNLDLFRAATEMNLPILFHLDNVRNTDQPGLPGLENVLKAFPEGKFIGHAQGFWASISGNVAQKDLHGYPRGPVAPGGALDRLMEKYSNLYCDVSADSGANAIRRDPKFGREFVIRRADRLLFGTDYLRDNQNISQFELYESLDLPASVKAKVYHVNASQLLGL